MKNLITQLENDRYDETHGSPEERAYRRGWNAGVKHAIDRARIELGLTEVRRSDDFAHDRFDLGGEG